MNKTVLIASRMCTTIYNKIFDSHSQESSEMVVLNDKHTNRRRKYFSIKLNSIKEDYGFKKGRLSNSKKKERPIIVRIYFLLHS